MAKKPKYGDENDSGEDLFDLEWDAHQQIAQALRKLPQSSRAKVVSSVFTLLGVSSHSYGDVSQSTASTSSSAIKNNLGSSFSADRTLSPKEFLLEKQPATDVERIACLGYYLAHYRDQPHFKTLEISKLNTEAAQRKFANSAMAMKNAIKGNYLVSAAKGMRQLSAYGEQFVQSLPDRDAARAVMTKGRPKRRASKPKAE